MTDSWRKTLARMDDLRNRGIPLTRRQEIEEADALRKGRKELARAARRRAAAEAEAEDRRRRRLPVDW